MQPYPGVILDLKLVFEEHLKNVLNRTGNTIGITKHLLDLIYIMVMYSFDIYLLFRIYNQIFIFTNTDEVLIFLRLCRRRILCMLSSRLLLSLETVH